MPGLVGLITKMPRAQAERQLAAMLESMRHEPFYETGTWTDECLGIYVGWTAIQGSFCDRMPVCNERGDITLAFSGEEFSSTDASGDLKRRGHNLHGAGPSYLVHLYEDDETFPANLNGQFHGLLVDRSQGLAMLFNDRFGMHRLYYHEAKEAFYFAAEAKAILAVRPDLRAADNRGLGELVSFGCVLEDRTLFRGINLLPSGSAWAFQNDRVERRRYFHPKDWEGQTPLDPKAYYEQLRDTLSERLPGFFNGGQPIGVALTGGLDTRVLMAWRKPEPYSLPCYTWSGTYRESQDVLVARKVAQLCKQEHQVVTLGREFLGQFARYAERSIYLTDGCVDVSRTPDLYLSERAREIAPVKVVGTYGSEVLRHAIMFKPMATSASDLYHPELVSRIQQAQNTYSELVHSSNPVTFVAFCQSPWYHHGILALEQTQLTVRSPYLDNNFVKTVFQSPYTDGAGPDIRTRLINDGNPELSKLRSDRGVGPGGLSGLATRAFLEFTFKSEYAYDYGMPQWVAKVDNVLAPFRLERLFLGRHKFAHFRVWYRDALAKYVQEVLLDRRTLSRPYLNRTVVENMVSHHLKGDRNFTTQIHRVLTLELLHRLFLDPQ